MTEANRPDLPPGGPAHVTVSEPDLPAPTDPPGDDGTVIDDAPTTLITAGPHALPPPAATPAPHGRCAWDERPLPPPAGRRPRLYCSDACKNAASRARKKTQLAEVTSAVAEAGTALEQARPLLEALQEFVARFGDKVDLAEHGALARLATLEAEAADDRADARTAREQVEAAETARIAAERGAREAFQAQRRAEEREKAARTDLERVARENREEATKLGTELGVAKAAQEHATAVLADQSNQLRALRTEAGELQAARATLKEQLAARDQELTAERTRAVRLGDQLAEQRGHADALTAQLTTAQRDSGQARAETRTVRAELDELRHDRDQQIHLLRAELKQLRAQGTAIGADLARVQALHESNQERILDLRDRCDDLKNQREALRTEVSQLRARLTLESVHPEAED